MQPLQNQQDTGTEAVDKRKRELHGQLGSTLGSLGGSPGPAASIGVLSSPGKFVQNGGQYVMLDEHEQRQKGAQQKLWK